MELSNHARIFKALSNEQRLRIFFMIYQQCCGSNIHKSKSGIKMDASCRGGPEGMEKAFSKACKCISLSRSTISHHFKELQNAGIISCERKGRTYLCTVNKDAVNLIRTLFA